MAFWERAATASADVVLRLDRHPQLEFENPFKVRDKPGGIGWGREHAQDRILVQGGCGLDQFGYGPAAAFCVVVQSPGRKPHNADHRDIPVAARPEVVDGGDAPALQSESGAVIAEVGHQPRLDRLLEFAGSSESRRN